MNMTLNELMVKHNFISKIKFTEGDSTLSTDLRVKIMGMRIEYGKVRKQFEDDLKQFTETLTTDELKELAAKPDKTPEEEKKVEEASKQITEDYNEYVNKRGLEEVNVKELSLTEDDYNQIVECNSLDEVEINGTKISAPDFLEVIYSLFVE